MSTQEQASLLNKEYWESIETAANQRKKIDNETSIRKLSYLNHAASYWQGRADGIARTMLLLKLIPQLPNTSVDIDAASRI